MPSPALDRIRALLLASAGPADTSRGYLDLLGADTVEVTGLGHWLMHTPVIPLVYERWWRPALGRVAKGLRGPSMAGEYDAVRSALGLRPGDVVLDIACGPGNFTRRFGVAVEPGGLAIGLDASPAMLARAVAETRHRDVGFLRASANDLPLQSSCVDAVCCFAALHMFPDPWQTLDEVTRVLRPGGTVAVFTSARRPGLPWRLVDDAAGLATGMRMFDRGEISAALTERGFTVVTEQVAGVTQFVAGALPADD